MQAGRELKRSQRAPRRTGQTNHMFGIPDGSVSNGYQKRGRKMEFVNDSGSHSGRRVTNPPPTGLATLTSAARSGAVSPCPCLPLKCCRLSRSILLKASRL